MVGPGWVVAALGTSTPANPEGESGLRLAPLARVCLCCRFILFLKEKETWPGSSKGFEAPAKAPSQELLGLAMPLQAA